MTMSWRILNNPYDAILSLPKVEWVERLRIRANELMEESQ